MAGRRLAVALVSITALVAACQREPAPLPDTRTMGAAPSRGSAPHPRAGASEAVSNEDLGAGRTIAAQGAPGAAACASCHGANGEGNAQSGFPRIAGLGRAYIEHQLNSYADGTRANPVMTPIAGALSAQQRTQVAAYYAGTGHPDAAPAPANVKAPALVANGDDKRGIPSCAKCHGPQGAGDAAANPPLAGQNVPYLAAVMDEWKSGARHNDATGRMPAIAKALDDDEVKAVIAYYAALPPPAPKK